MKPYRLINTLELQELKTYIDKVLMQWNAAYSIAPLCAGNLEGCQETPACADASLVQQDDQVLALIDGNYTKTIIHAVFGEDKPCFNPIAQELFLLLMKQLFETDNCSIKTELFNKKNWLYPGSTCLKLTLNCFEESCIVILNPDWVYQQLPREKINTCTISNLDEALEAAAIPLQVELMPMQLSLEQLLKLQTGDIIACDHPISQALRLTENRKPIAQVHLGQTSDFKSIQLKRFS